ncbi:MAG: histidine-type phosphatase, partial [Bacteroidales bacterium]|nr:histidine-type phosphatase [Bacteroidales bacterium]
MKKIFASIAAALLICTAASAQNYNVLDEVKADRLKAAGMEGAYRFENYSLTPAPKGYRPFYISHYGRHGSRYAW